MTEATTATDEPKPTNGAGNGSYGSNGSSAKVPPERWPTASRAARIIGVKPQVISAMVQRGELHPVQDASGMRHYDPEELELYMKEELETDQESKTVAELTASLRVLTGAMGDYLKLIPEPTQKVQAVLLQIIDRQGTRIADLEKDKLGMLDSLADMIRGQEDREVAKMRAIKSEERWDKCTDALTEQGPRFLQDFALGADLRRLFERMDPLKIDALLEIDGMLTEDEKAVFTKVRDRMKSQQETLARKAKEREERDQKAKQPPGKDDVPPITTEGSEVV